MERIDNYLQILYLAEEFEVIEEGLGDVVKKFTIDKAKSFVKKLVDSIKSGNEGAIKSLVKSSGFAKIKVNAIDKFMGNKSSDYAMAERLASKVLKNSLPGKPKPETIDRAASYIAIRSVMIDKKGEIPNVTANVRKHLKNFVTKTNKYYDDYEQRIDEVEREGKKPPIPKDSLPDYVVGAVIVMGFIFIAGSTTWWLYNNLTFIIILIITVVASLASIYHKEIFKMFSK